MKQTAQKTFLDTHLQLTDTFLEEGDPDRWPGHGIEVAAMDKQLHYTEKSITDRL